MNFLLSLFLFCAPASAGSVIDSFGDPTMNGQAVSPATVAIATSAVLAGSVLTSSGSVIIVSTTPDAGHDTLSVRAQDNSAVFTVESLTSGTGRVGIGTASPGASLDVAGSALIGSAVAGSNILTIGGAPTDDSTAYLRFVKSNAVKSWQIAQNHLAVGLEFVPSTANGGLTFNVPAMVILDGGNVGIGNANPNQALSLTGAATFSSSVTAGGDLLISKQYSPQITFRRFTNFSGGDQPMYIETRGPNASGNDTIWHTETVLTPDATNGSEDSVYILAVQQAGTVTNKLVIGTGITAISSVTVQAAIQTNGAGSVFVSSTTQPTIACSAGTGTLALGSSDQAGKITAGAAAANCTLTFATAYPKAPACFCNNETTTDLARATSTTTTLVCTSADGNFGAEVISYFCMGNP